MNPSKKSRTIQVDDIRERLGEHYGCDPYERPFKVEPVVNHYGEIGSVYCSLNGSPPKGHALFIAGSVGRVIFMDVRGHVFDEWRNVKLDYGLLASGSVVHSG